MPHTAAKPPTSVPGPSFQRLPALNDETVAGGLQMWKAALVEGTRYWSDMPRRGFPPMTAVSELIRWTSVMTNRRPPTWSSPHTLVWSTPIARLRDFTDGATDAVVPTLLLPPQAGHDSCIVDFSPRQSQVKVARAAGLTRLFSLDWVGATQATKNATITHYLAVIDRAMDSLGGRANLVGDCQGGWLATVYAALRPERVHTLTMAGAPIDFTAGDPTIGQWMSRLGAADLAFYRNLVANAGGVMPGRHMLSGFILLKPEAEVAKHLRLLSHLDDEHVTRYRVFEDWFRHTQDIPGAFYLWIIKHLFRDNELIKGRLVVGGKRVDLSRIRCPLNLLGGATDHITPPVQVFAAADHVGTPPEEITKATTRGGHLGLFMGAEALREYWPAIFTDVARRSPREVRAESAVRTQTAAHAPLVPAP